MKPKRTTNDFQKRYERWKNGEQVYKNGRPVVSAPADAPWSYKQWVELMQNYKGINIENDRTYNYELYFNDNPTGAWEMLNDNPTAHFTDDYKTSLHPSASNLSIYSGNQSEYNPRGIEFGHWDGNNKYYAPLSPDASWDDIIDNAVFNEPGGLTVFDSYGRLPYLSDGSYFGGSLPEVTVTGTRKLQIPKFDWNK